MGGGQNSHVKFWGGRNNDEPKFTGTELEVHLRKRMNELLLPCQIPVVERFSHHTAGYKGGFGPKWAETRLRYP
jgi:hypothetical protein